MVMMFLTHEILEVVSAYLRLWGAYWSFANRNETMLLTVKK